ncbi:MAG: hypothetical protein IPL55_09495 [Saprospiraceae bacterium]|nr:hypothetical protein [Saprospiraceae bacterium]
MYAIGEILLVVIGILIALQINNWNQANSDSRIAHEYMTNLVTELSSDLDYFKQLISNNDKQKSYIDDILIALNTEKTTKLKEKELMLKLMEATDPADFFPKTATYQDLVSSGKMILIKPLDLRQKIITHYNLVEQKSLHINRELGYSWDHLIPFLNDNGFYEWRNFPAISLDTTLISRTKHFSILDIKKSSKDFEAAENNLFFAKLMLTVRNKNLEELIQSTQKLIDEVVK